MATVEELFRDHQRRLRGLQPGDPQGIEQLEALIGRALPRELRAYHRLAGGNPGNLAFIQTHKTIRPTLREALDWHAPRRHGGRRRQEGPASRIFFGDGEGCQDCGPAFLLLSPSQDLPTLEIDPEDPPVVGSDYDELVLLAPRLTDYLLSCMPAKTRP